MFLSSQRLNDTEVCDRLGRNIALEYTRDSPLFRQQLNAFEESSQGLSEYTEGIKSALQVVNEAINNLQKAHNLLGSRLLGRGNNHSRCLFTNSFPKLGILTNTLHEISDTLININDNLDTLKTLLVDNITGLLNQIQNNEQETMDINKKKFEKLSEIYENRLISSLSSREISPQFENELCDIRLEFELQRFDYVAKLNQNNCQKKYILTKVSCQILSIFESYFNQGVQIVSNANQKLESIQSALPDTREEIDSQEMLWGRVRARLQGELIGAMPAPGAPPGSFSPIQPRRHQGIPLYSTAITTEVLSINTRKATFDDIRHANDEGVFKQGYLCVKSGLFGSKKRKWHRLYATKLYIVELAVGQPSCSMEPICDISNCSVSAKPSSDIPYVFLISTNEGNRYEFQAESEDDMVLWISAIRRCSHTTPGRHTTAVGRKLIDASGEAIPIPEEDEDAILVPPESLQEGPGRKLLRQFVQQNLRCAECNAGPVRWISTSIGVSLCQQCAIVHRQLTWAVSKLKNIELDEFSEWQMKILLYELGNNVVNSIWEKSIPDGWIKPTKHSSYEEKSKWILAKYKWYAFTSTDEMNLSDQQLIEMMNIAIQNGNLRTVLLYLSLKGQVNYCDVLTGDSFLHRAIQYNQLNIFGFLLLNGANIYCKNKSGATPEDLIENSKYSKNMGDILLQIKKGHY